MSDQTQSGISRRTLAKGAAWTVPAAAVVAAAPAYAKSGNPPKIVGGQAFKLSGNSCSDKAGDATGNRKAYLFTFQVTNNTGEAIYLYGATISVTGTNLNFQVRDADPDWGTKILHGKTVGIGVWANGTNSGNQGFTVSAQVFWGHTAVELPFTPITSNAANPDKLPNGQPWHAPVPVGPWTICATPTLESQGYPSCISPGYVTVYTNCA